MTILDRKVVRDLTRMKGQSAAIALVIGCGVAMLIMAYSTMGSLRTTLENFYATNRFTDVFVHLKRAPDSLADRLAAIPGVAQLQTRVVVSVTLDIPTTTEPAIGRLISIDPRDPMPLNAVYLRAGRLPQPNSDEEVVASEGFVNAHKYVPGDRVKAVINGRFKSLRIVGVGLSPEFIYQIPPGGIFPDDKRYGIFWMDHEALAAAYDLEGSFNDVAVALSSEASLAEVIRDLDRLTAPYGSLGAYGREDQLSHRFLSDEIAQLSRMGVFAPAIFLFVSAFLLNVVLNRIVSTEREQIAVLKAFGYSRFEVGVHYLQFAVVITAAGLVIGTIAGVLLGRDLAYQYTQFYHFPRLEFDLNPTVVAVAAVVSLGSAAFGSSLAVRKAATLPAAEAMRPEPPARYRATIVERIGLSDWLSQPARMVLRHLERTPWKSSISVLGIALAVSVLIVGSFIVDALDYIIDVQFRVAQRQDMTVMFVEPLSVTTLHDVERFPGVMACEAFRSVPVKIRSGHRVRRTGLTGLVDTSRMQQLLNDQIQAVDLPENGLLLEAKLAEILDVRPGDVVELEVLEGSRAKVQVVVSRVVKQFFGVAAYINLEALWRLLCEGQTISGAFVTADPAQIDTLYTQIKATPGVAGVAVKKAAIENFQKTVAENILRMQMFNVIFASIIAFGVVYNCARIALSERSRELASLRVMGFTRAEISSILLGELAVLTLAALPVGALGGWLLAGWMTSVMDTEMYRIPWIVDRATIGTAIVVTLIAAVISGLVVRRRLDRLDLVAVLKSRE
jgi:putative ABC transport system permease protein